MTKIAMIGAGSTVFVKHLLTDLFLTPEIGAMDIALMDIDADRLETSRRVAEGLVGRTGADARVTSTTDRAAALDGADFVVIMIQVGGYRPATVIDFDVPERFGLRQTIADTMGAGGIMRALRTVPVLLDIANDMRRLCPQALMLQYANPMAMSCWALGRLAPDIKVVGLCHSVQKTSQMLADHLGEDIADISYDCAGINHMAFFTRFEKVHGDTREDLYPRLRQVEPPADERVRYDILKRFGYFVTESSEHFAEYVPWYIKADQPDLIDRFNIPLNEYPRRCEEQIARWATLEETLLSDDAPALERSVEYAADIVRAHNGGPPAVIYGNVINHGLIDNLPDGCCVEVPCVVDRSGLTPMKVGSLPVQLTSLMLTNVAAQACAVDAIVTGDREQVCRAMALDPHTGAELSLDQIWALEADLHAEHQTWLGA